MLGYLKGNDPIGDPSVLHWSVIMGGRVKSICPKSLLGWSKHFEAPYCSTSCSTPFIEKPGPRPEYLKNHQSLLTNLFLVQIKCSFCIFLRLFCRCEWSFIGQIQLLKSMRRFGWTCLGERTIHINHRPQDPVLPVAIGERSPVPQWWLATCHEKLMAVFGFHRFRWIEMKLFLLRTSWTALIQAVINVKVYNFIGSNWSQSRRKSRKVVEIRI